MIWGTWCLPRIAAAFGKTEREDRNEVIRELEKGSPISLTRKKAHREFGDCSSFDLKTFGPEAPSSDFRKGIFEMCRIGIGNWLALSAKSFPAVYKEKRPRNFRYRAVVFQTFLTQLDEKWLI
jgi:hypothetical protein